MDPISGICFRHSLQCLMKNLHGRWSIVCWLRQIEQPPTYHGFDDCLFFAYGEQVIPFTEGDVLCLATIITDEYGRTTVRGGSEWELEIAGETPVEVGKTPPMVLEEQQQEVGYYRYEDPALWGL